MWTKEKQAQLDALTKEKQAHDNAKWDRVEDLVSRLVMHHCNTTREITNTLIDNAAAFREVLEDYDETIRLGLPVSVVHEPTRAVVLRCQSVIAAEAYIAWLAKTQRTEVERGDYGIDAPEVLT